MPPSFLVFVTSDMMQMVTSPFEGNMYSESIAVIIKETINNFFGHKFEDARLGSIL